jgi:GNAT superfamily N-acetyltransferase/uncharacterized damage-inducible protein DinB
VRIVPWQARYGDAFARLNLEWIERYFRVEEPDRKYLGDPRRTILAAGGEIFYAVRGDAVVGTAAAIPSAPGTMELAKMAVAPSEQGRGLGRLLVDQVTCYARGVGTSHIELLTNSGLAPALRLYASAGFQREPVPDAQYYERGDVYMRLALARPPRSFDYLLETWDTERLKTLTVWSEFADGDLGFRAAPAARTPHEHMGHQCVSEDTWCRTMLGLDTGLPALPPDESRYEFMLHYARTSALRLALLREQEDRWFQGDATFFDVTRSRAWILVRRIAHTAHHRGQLTLCHRLLRHALYSTYGPTADTGGLLQHEAPVIYRYRSVGELLQAELDGGHRPALPGPGNNPATERP